MIPPKHRMIPPRHLLEPSPQCVTQPPPGASLD
eukprot:CAMPEP_0172171018 /NCGR_PEP_ID=MMETSP1050-20130122/11653_1 /TAXON_ID=233186 /ORGANISM="Cryptomonas curvata, Strain CCAP979/52" /LENGTH=32 /DNA_ID= /DNA_START= /DNA_END= /DNA_ORIENTATION=